MLNARLKHMFNIVGEWESLQMHRRQLGAAGEEFAEQVFAKVMVRVICSPADAKVAAINYSFRNNEWPYCEAIKDCSEISHLR